jgi:hypothetical protein
MKALGEPPQPRERFAACLNDAPRRALVDSAWESAWEAGYVEALFDGGEQLYRLFAPRFDSLWAAVGRRPGDPGAAGTRR